MAVYINTNIASVNARRYVDASAGAVLACLRRLSSGLRINGARDDAAGLAIVARMTSQLDGFNVAARNANDAISLLQTADSAVASVSATLQRMRLLAVQAANGINSATDRAALDKEMQQLSAGIEFIANTTAFNGFKLLDGHFKGQAFQVGANAHDRVQVDSIKSMQTSELGSTGSTFQARTTGSAVLGALGDGDLTLNGVAVGASHSGAGPGQDASSAFAVAAAINAVFATSGVIAAAQATVLHGSAPTSFGTIAAGSFSVNGVSFGAITGDGTAAGQGAALAAAITDAAGLTGVTAAADPVSGAVTLTAADGRNIAIDMPGVAVNVAAAVADQSLLLSQTGFAGAAVGTEAVLPITARNDISFSGSLVHAYVGRTIVINGVTFTIADSAAASQVVDAHHVTLNIDIAGGGGDAASTANALLGAIGLAQADPLTAAALGTVTAAATAAATVELTDVTPGASTTAIASNLPTATVTRPVTGVAGLSATSGVTRGTVALTGNGKDGLDIGGASPGAAGFSDQHVDAITVATVVGIDTLDLLTADNAQNAIGSIDSALQATVNARVALGAYQSRFSAAIANMQNTAENLAASRSRIQDADYAVETAGLSRALVIQQAGIAMLAHANASPSLALWLLK